jgi:hypothetical protein
MPSRRPPVLVAVVLAAVAACAVASRAASVDPPRRQLGMNLGGVADWSSEWPFADAFKTSRAWVEVGDGPFTYDDRGNPLLRAGQAVETYLFRGIDGHYPPGEYVCSWSGAGEIEILEFDVAAVPESRPGLTRFHVRRPTDAGVRIKVVLSPMRDPVRSIRVRMPALAKKDAVFHPLYLERLKAFRIIRFMDWQKTNNSPLLTWSQRPKPDDIRYSTDVGVPPEVMIDLANASGADPWFCMPHQADDDFVRSFGKLARERLDPRLTVYLEYSNEVWNWGFEQAGYAAERARKLKLGEPENLRYYSQRSVEVFDRFAEGLGPGRKLMRVLAGQFASPWVCEQVLTWNDAYKKADALAVGAYFGHDFGSPEQFRASLRQSPASLLDRCSAEVEGPHRDLIRQHAALAKKLGLQFLAYEGGQHLVGHGGAENNVDLAELFQAANRHPRMAELYRRQLELWFAEGGGPFVAFSYAGIPGKFGSWGVLEYQDQPVAAAPKYRALTEFAKRLTP